MLPPTHPLCYFLRKASTTTSMHLYPGPCHSCCNFKSISYFLMPLEHQLHEEDRSTWCMVGVQSVHLHESVDTAGTQSRHPQEDGAVIGTVLSSPSASIHTHALLNPHTHTHTCACTRTAHLCVHTCHVCVHVMGTGTLHMCAHSYIYMPPTPHLCVHVCTCIYTMHVYMCEQIHAYMHTLRSAKPNSPVPGPGASQ